VSYHPGADTQVCPYAECRCRDYGAPVAPFPALMVFEK
jgi:hypothetical protein